MSVDFKDLQIIKDRLNKENKVEELLEHMGCEKINHEQGGELIVCQLPSKFKSNNTRSVQVKLNKHLSSVVRSRNMNGDIFNLVSYLVNSIPANEVQDDLSNAKQWVIEVMNYHDVLDGRYNFKPKREVNSWLKDIKKKRNKVNTDTFKPNEPIDEKVKLQYVMRPWYEWIQEGISYQTQVEYEVGYDLWTDRVVNMIRNKDGELIGVKGRYVGDNEEILDKKKYLYIKKMNKSLELFNLHKALPYIKKHKCVIVWEGYKSVMKCHSIGIYNCVSIEGDDISPVQISLLKELGIDITIILAFDKDKMKRHVDSETGEIELYPRDIMEQAEQITNREVYAIVDDDDLLEEKDSPIDKGKKIFAKLYKKRLKLPIDNIFSR